MAGHRINEKESEDLWLQQVTSRYNDSSWSPKLTKDASIYRVPKFLKDLNHEAYLPRVVSLGLFHHKPLNPLSEIDHRKVDAVLTMKQNLSGDKKEQLAKILMDSVSQIRKCYQDDVETNDEYVAWACLLDGCFILDILDIFTRSDGIRSFQFDILLDLFIMENQIPVHVLLKILELQEGDLQLAKKTLYKKVREVSRIVHPFLPKEPLERNYQDGIKDVERYEYGPMLDLFHRFVIENPEDESDALISIKHLIRTTRPQRTEEDYLNKFIKASASELYKVGLKFKAYYGVPCQEKLRFYRRKRTISLPALFITDTSEVILRNLMAMEVCSPEKHKQLSYYMLLLNTLVESENDVAVLRRAGVIQSSMGTDAEVMNLLNGLRKGLNLQDDRQDPFVEMKLQLNNWYNKRPIEQQKSFSEQHPVLSRFLNAVFKVITFGL